MFLKVVKVFRMASRRWQVGNVGMRCSKQGYFVRSGVNLNVPGGNNAAFNQKLVATRAGDDVLELAYLFPSIVE